MLLGVLLTTVGALGGSTPESSVAAVVVLAVGMFALIVLAPALCETWWNGRTPDKALLGLRVVTSEGGPITFRQALVRGIVQLVELPLGVAVLVALSSPRGQRLGDLAAGTFVISERAASLSTVPTHFSPPPGLEAYCAQLDVSRLTSEQFLLVRNFLLRVGAIDASARFALALRLAEATSRRCAPPPPVGVPPEVYLIGICAAYLRRYGGVAGGS